ncbi:MAG: GTP 3',8-cyclase MoaA [Candidatus Nanopelagicaceae bacterium]|nr:GTP 3',8-cyclase MoaA [Candidatus Nanopelagicaceae bacterium]
MSLIDKYGRVHRDLRVSLTDRCSLRCTYCMPFNFDKWLPSETLLTAPEIVKVIEIAVSQGIKEVRLTGGEPLLRPDIVEIVSRINALENVPELSMTTNGVALAKVANELAKAGLKRINISLDTLDWERFKRLTFRDRYDDVIEGIAAARAAGLAPIKINTVLMRDINGDEALPLLKWALKESLNLRFIEQMPLDAGDAWTRSNLITADEIYNQISSEFELTPVAERGSSPAEEFYINGGPATVGIIGSVTRSFCANCDRLRLTSDGQLRNCLFSNEETDLRSILRNRNLTEREKLEDIVKAFGLSVKAKLPGHGINNPDFVKPVRPMSAIGG